MNLSEIDDLIERYDVYPNYNGAPYEIVQALKVCRAFLPDCAKHIVKVSRYGPCLVCEIESLERKLLAIAQQQTSPTSTEAIEAALEDEVLPGEDTRPTLHAYNRGIRRCIAIVRQMGAKDTNSQVDAGGDIRLVKEIGDDFISDTDNYTSPAKEQAISGTIITTVHWDHGTRYGFQCGRCDYQDSNKMFARKDCPKCGLVLQELSDEPQTIQTAPVSKHSPEDVYKPDVVEKVARAIFLEEYGITSTWEAQPVSVKEQYYELAQAAICAYIEAIAAVTDIEAAEVMIKALERRTIYQGRFGDAAARVLLKALRSAGIVMRRG